MIRQRTLKNVIRATGVGLHTGNINLQGARGILVNITGGLDLAIGEFDEVGNAVKEFASEDAVVVVGTVIDPELKDEIRVTMVATGLKNESPQLVEPAMKLVQTNNNGKVDYGKLERPAVMRQKADRVRSFQAKPKGDMNLDYLDIPAFLRRQAD